MTVKHLQQIQRRQLILAVSLDRTVLEKFRTGFTECATEVQSFISQLEDVDPGLKQRLTTYLDSSVNKLEKTTPVNFANVIDSNRPSTSWNANLLQIPVPGSSSGQDDLNNNQRMHLDLVPTRLATGELAFVMPNSSNLQFNATPSTSRLLANSSTPRFSAFSVVGDRTRLTSPPLSPVSSQDDRQETSRSFLNNSPMSVFHSTLGNSSLGNITLGTSLNSPFSSRFDSGYKTDMSDLIQKPTVPQQSYMDLFKRTVAGPLTSSDSENSAIISVRSSYNGSNLSAENSQENRKEENGEMWRPW